MYKLLSSFHYALQSCAISTSHTPSKNLYIQEAVRTAQAAGDCDCVTLALCWMARAEMGRIASAASVGTTRSPTAKSSAALAACAALTPAGSVSWSALSPLFVTGQGLAQSGADVEEAAREKQVRLNLGVSGHHFGYSSLPFPAVYH